MCKLIEELKELAEQVITKEHTELDFMFTKEDRIDFVNSVRTLQEHSCYLVKEMTKAA